MMTQEKLEASRTGPAPQGRIQLPREILDGVRNRDRQALEQFFEAYFDGIYSCSHRLMGDRCLAEDVAQEVFLRVHRGAPQLDTSRDPWPWLMAITCNVCRDAWRSGNGSALRGSVSLDENPELEGRLHSSDPGPDSGLEARERQELVQKAIAECPETQRAVVLLRAYSGLSHEEIASVVNMTPVAVRKAYSRALSALGARLEATLGAESGETPERPNGKPRTQRGVA